MHAPLPCTVKLYSKGNFSSNFVSKVCRSPKALPPSLQPAYTSRRPSWIAAACAERAVGLMAIVGFVQLGIAASHGSEAKAAFEILSKTRTGYEDRHLQIQVVHIIQPAAVAEATKDPHPVGRIHDRGMRRPGWYASYNLRRAPGR